MTITPISNMESISSQIKSLQTEQEGSDSFSDIFKNAIENVNKTDEITKQDAELIATGQADDLHTITMNIAKADLALQTLVQMRNKALDAYTEIMRIPL